MARFATHKQHLVFWVWLQLHTESVKNHLGFNPSFNIETHTHMLEAQFHGFREQEWLLFSLTDSCRAIHSRKDRERQAEINHSYVLVYDNLQHSLSHALCCCNYWCVNSSTYVFTEKYKTKHFCHKTYKMCLTSIFEWFC